MRTTGGEGGQRGGWWRAVSQLNGGRGGRQSCSALHTPESTGSWIRLSWACNSSRLDTSYSGSDRCSRTEEGGAHRKRGIEVSSGTTAVDKSRRKELKEIQPVVTFLTLPCNRAYQSDCLGSQRVVMCMCISATWILWKHEKWGRQRVEVKSRATVYPPVGPLMFSVKIIGTESSNENDFDI